MVLLVNAAVLKLVIIVEGEILNFKSKLYGNVYMITIFEGSLADKDVLGGGFCYKYDLQLVIREKRSMFLKSFSNVLISFKEDFEYISICRLSLV